MKWWSVLIVLAIGAIIALGGVWLWRRKGKIDAAAIFSPPPTPRDDPAVRSAIERGKQRIADLFDNMKKR